MYDVKSYHDQQVGRYGRSICRAHSERTDSTVSPSNDKGTLYRCISFCLHATMKIMCLNVSMPQKIRKLVRSAETGEEASCGDEPPFPSLKKKLFAKDAAVDVPHHDLCSQHLIFIMSFLFIRSVARRPYVGQAVAYGDGTDGGVDDQRPSIIDVREWDDNCCAATLLEAAMARATNIETVASDRKAVAMTEERCRKESGQHGKATHGGPEMSTLGCIGTGPCAAISIEARYIYFLRTC